MPRSEFDIPTKLPRLSEFYMSQYAVDEEGVSPFSKRLNEAWGLAKELPFDPYEQGRESQYGAGLIPYEDGYAFGTLPANIATSMAFADDYHRGIFTYNQARSNLTAKRILRGQELIEDPKGEAGLSDTSKDFLEPFLSTKSNWLKFGGDWKDIGRYVDVGSGFAAQMFQQPEDLFEYVQENYSADKMLDIMADTSPGHLAYLELNFGGREGLKKITEDATNSDAFMYFINEAIDHKAVAQSISFHQKEMEGMEEFWNLTAWPFIRDGLINDPDMPASIVISLGITAATLGVGAPIAAGFFAGRVLKKVHGAATIAKGITNITKLSTHATKIAKIVDWLPENIGTTIFSKIAPDLGKRLAKTKGLRGMLYSSPLNAGEGFVEGALAEGINQTLKIKRGFIDEYDLGGIWAEAKMEAVFSVVANPILGTAMKYTVNAPLSAAGGIIGQGIMSLPLGARLRSSITEAWKAAARGSDNPILAAIEHYELGDSVVDSLNSIRQEGGDIDLNDLMDGPLGFVLDPWQIRDGVNTYDDVTSILSLLEEIKNDLDGEKISDDVLLDEIANRLIQRLGGPEAQTLAKQLGERTAIAKTRLRVARYVRKLNEENGTNFTPEEWLNQTDEISDEDLWEIYVDDNVESMVRVRMDKEGLNFDTATAAEKLKVVHDIEVEVEEKFREKEEKLKLSLEANTTELERLKQKAEDVDSLIQAKEEEEDSVLVDIAIKKRGDVTLTKEEEKIYNEHKEAVDRIIKKQIKESPQLAPKKPSTLRRKVSLMRAARKRAKRLKEAGVAQAEREKAMAGIQDKVERKGKIQAQITGIVESFAGEIFRMGFYWKHSKTGKISHKRKKGMEKVEIDREKVTTVEELFELEDFASKKETVRQLTVAIKKIDAEIKEVTDKVPETDWEISDRIAKKIIADKKLTEEEEAWRKKDLEGEGLVNARIDSLRAQEGEQQSAVVQTTKEKEEAESLKAALEEEREGTTDPKIRNKLDELIAEMDELISEFDESIAAWQDVESDSEALRDVKKEIGELTEKVKEIRDAIDTKYVGEKGKRISKLSLVVGTLSKTFVDTIAAEAEAGKHPKWRQKGEMDKNDVSPEEWADLEEAVQTWETIKSNEKNKASLLEGIKSGRVKLDDLRALALGLIGMQNEIFTKVIQPSDEYRQLEKLEEDMKRLDRKREKISLRYKLDMARKYGFASYQLKTIRAVLDYRNKELKTLTIRRHVLTKKLETTETISAEDLLGAFLPESATKDRVKKEIDERADSDEDPIVYSKEEALAIFEEAAKERETYIKSIKRNYFKDVNWSRVSNRPITASQWGINQATEAPAIDRTNTEAANKTAINKESIDRGIVPEEYAFTLAEELMALQEFHSQLISVLEGPWGRALDPEVGLVPIFVVDSCLPDGIYDAVFREVIVNAEGEEFPSNRTMEDLSLEYDTLFVRLDKLIALVTRRIMRANGDLKAISKESLTDLVRRIRGRRLVAKEGDAKVQKVLQRIEEKGEKWRIHEANSWVAEIRTALQDGRINELEARQIIHKLFKAFESEEGQLGLFRYISGINNRLEAEGKTLVSPDLTDWGFVQDVRALTLAGEGGFPKNLLKSLLHDFKGDEGLVTFIKKRDTAHQAVIAKNAETRATEEDVMVYDRDPKSKIGLYTAIAFTDRLMKASRAVDDDLFNQYGFLIDLTDNLSPDLDQTITFDLDDPESRAEAEMKYLEEVRKGIVEQLEVLFMQSQRQKKDIYAYFKIPEDLKDLDRIASIILDRLAEGDNEHTLITRDEIISMGDGTRGWQPARRLGWELVDFALVTRLKTKEIVTKRRKSPEYRSERKEENRYEEPQEGETVRTHPMLRGHMTSFAPERPEAVALVIEDAIVRKRLEFIFTEEIDENDIIEYNAYLEDKDGAVPGRPVSRSLQPDARLLPPIINVRLNDRITTREELKNILSEVLLDTANIAYAFLHDARWAAGPGLVYTSEGDAAFKMIHPELTTGLPTIVPMSGISSILALESMNMHLEGLANDVIQQATEAEQAYAKEHYKEFGPKYWENPEFYKRILSPKTYLDKKFNGLFVTKILSLGSEAAITAMGELRNKMNMSIEAEDYYIRAGLGFAETVRRKALAHPEYGELLSPMVTFYDQLATLGIDDHTKYTDYVSNEGSDPDMVRKMKLMREFWKPEVMRRLYTMGWKGWVELQTDPMFVGILTRLRQEFGFNFKDQSEGISHVMALFGHSIFDHIAGENAAVIDVALGIEGLREEARKILSMHENMTDRHITDWISTVKSMRNKEIKKTDQNNPAMKRDYLRRQLDLNIAMLAKREMMIGPDGERVQMTVEAFKEKYKNSRLMKADAIIRKADARAKPGEGGKLTLAEREEVGQLLQPKGMHWKHNQLFRALNTVNSTGFRVAVDVLKAQAATNHQRFNEEDLLGIQNFILYQIFLPGLESYRTYSASSNMNRHHHNTMFARIQTNQDAFKSFVAEEIRDEDWDNPAKIGRKIMEWSENPYEYVNGKQVFVDVEGESPLGQWRMEDNPHQKIPVRDKNGKVRLDKYGNPIMRMVDFDNDAEVAEWHKRMDHTIAVLMMRNEMLLRVTEPEKPPLSKYKAEDNMDELEAEVLSQWWEHSQEAAIDHTNAQRLQQDSVRNADGSRNQASIDYFSKGIGLLVPVAGHPMTFRGSAEHTMTELRHDTEDMVFESTDKPRGYMSWAPETRRMPYHNKGNLYLQNKAYHAAEREMMSPIEEVSAMLDQPLENPDHLIPVTSRGFEKPWNRETLPMGPDVKSDYLDYLMGLDANAPEMVANVVEMKMSKWAIERGFEAEMLDPEMVPYLYLVYRFDQKLEHEMDQIISAVRYGDKGLTNEEKLLQARNTYLEGFHALFQLSRDIRYKEMSSLLMETKGHEIGILNPDLADRTLYDILTSPYSENNPFSVLSGPTLIHKALKKSLVPTEHFIIEEGVNPGETIKLEETAIHPLLVQSVDELEFLVGVLWDGYISEAIETYIGIVKEPALKKQLRVIANQRDIQSFNAIPPDHREAIINVAREKAVLANDPVFSFDFIVESVEGRNDLVKLIQQQPTKDERTDKMILRNPMGGPFTMLMRVPRTVIGTNMKLGITPMGALLMLSSHKNYPFIERIETAMRTNKPTGRYRSNAEGKPELVRSDAEEMADYFGYSETEKMNRERVLSEAMEIIVDRVESGHTVAHMLVDGSRSSGNIKPRVVDWINYYRPDAGLRPNALPFFIESLISPITTAMKRLSSLGLLEMNIMARAAPERTMWSQHNPTKAVEILTSLGLDEAEAANIIEIQSNPNWIYDTDNVISIDIETTMDLEQRIVGIGGVERTLEAAGRVGFKKGKHFSPTRSVSGSEARALLKMLKQHLLAGGKVVTYNGNSFDLRKLGILANDLNTAQIVAELSIDLMQNNMLADSKFLGGDITQSLNWTLNSLLKGLKLGEKSEEGMFAAALKKRGTRVNGEPVVVTEKDLSLAFERAGSPIQADAIRRKIAEINERSPEASMDLYNKYISEDAEFNEKILKELVRRTTPVDIEAASEGPFRGTVKGKAKTTFKTIVPTWNIEMEHSSPHSQANSRGLSLIHDLTGVRESYMDVYTDGVDLEHRTIQELLVTTLQLTDGNIKNPATIRAIILGLMLRQPDIEMGEVRVFFPLMSRETAAEKEKFDADVSSAYLRVKGEFNQLMSILNATDSQQFNDFYWDARSYVDQISEGERTVSGDSDITIDFLAYLQEIYDIEDMSTEMHSSAEAALASVLDTHVFDRDPDLFNELHLKSRDLRNHDNFSSAVPELGKLSLKIKEAVDGGRLSEAQARMIRAILGKWFKYAPDMVLEVNFEFLDSEWVDNSGKQRRGSAEKSGGRYTIRIGNQLVGRRDALSVAYLVAEEIGHIGRMMFIENDSYHYREWRTLFLRERSKQGGGTLKKLVMAFHNGQWNKAAQDEYARIMNDTTGEEFIAALTGYHLVHDSLELLRQVEANTPLTSEEAGFFAKTQTIIDKIFAFIGKILDRVSSVFSDFKSTEPAEYERAINLIRRTLGQDATKTSRNTIADVGNPDMGPLYMSTEGTQQQSTVENTENELLATLQSLDEVKRRMGELEDAIHHNFYTPEAPESESGKFEKEWEELSKERGQLENRRDTLGGNKITPLGITTGEFLIGRENLKNQYSVRSGDFSVETYGPDLLDVKRIFVEGTPHDQQILATQILMDMTKMMRGNDGRFMAEATKAIQQLPYFNRPGGIGSKVKQFMTMLATGSTESGATWNSPFTLLVMLSTMIDNSMSTMAGHWGNMDGIPHVLGSVQQIDQISTEIRNSMERVYDDIIGPIESTVRFRTQVLGNTAGNEKTRDTFAKEVWTKLVKQMAGEAYEYTDALLVNSTELRKEADNIVTNYAALLGIVNHMGVEVGVMDRAFDEAIPFMFANAKVQDQPVYNNFREEMGKVIGDRIVTESQNIDLKTRRMCPYTLYAMGELPHLADPEVGLKELAELETKNPQLWKEIMAMAELMRQRQSERSTSYDSTLTRLASIKTNEEYRSLLTNKTSTIEQHNTYVNYVIPAIAQIMRYMRYKKNKFSADYLGFNSENTRITAGWWSKYRAEAKKPNQARLDILRGQSIDSRLATLGVVEGKSARQQSPTISSPVSVHVANIMNGAGRKIYFSNDWAIPPVHEVMNNPAIADMLVWGPETISDGIMKHLGQRIAEQSMYMDKYGIKATTGDVLGIFRNVLGMGNLFNSDGSRISAKDSDILTKAMGVLEIKYNTILGKQESNRDSADETLNFITRYAPDVVRIVFGTNLTMATLVVENTMNMIDQLLGRGSMGGFIKAAVAPLMGLDPNIRKNVARDMAEIIRIFNQGRIPDYARPDIDVRSEWYQRLPQWLGERNMHLAGILHQMIATSRATIFRGWLQQATVGGDGSKLKEFLRLHKQVDPKEWDTVDGRKIISKLMSRVGLPGTDAANIMYLMNEGVLTNDNVDILAKMVNSPKGDEYYSLGGLLTNLNKGEAWEGGPQWATTDPEYKQYLDIISGLRRAEKRYIHEILVDPNPFDTATGNSSWDLIFETFRRYPVLFASQQVGRRNQRFSLRRNALHWVSYAMVDSLYMSLLLVAAGYPLEDIIEGWEEDPVKQSLFMMARLPHFGRYIGLLMETVVGIYANTHREAFGFVPVGAMNSFLYNVKKLIDGWTDDEKDTDWASMVMLMRTLPVIGDALTRIIFFSAMGEEWQRQNNSMSRGAKSSNKKWATYGSFSETSNLPQYAADLREILRELGWEPKFENLPPAIQQQLLQGYNPSGATGTPKMQYPNPAATPAPAPKTTAPSVPSQAPAAPTPRPMRRDIVGAIRETRPERAPESLVGAPVGSPEWEDRERKAQQRRYDRDAGIID